MNNLKSALGKDDISKKMSASSPSASYKWKKNEGSSTIKRL